MEHSQNKLLASQSFTVCFLPLSLCFPFSTISKRDSWYVPSSQKLQGAGTPGLSLGYLCHVPCPHLVLIRDVCARGRRHSAAWRNGVDECRLDPRSWTSLSEVPWVLGLIQKVRDGLFPHLKSDVSLLQRRFPFVCPVRGFSSSVLCCLTFPKMRCEGNRKTPTWRGGEDPRLEGTGHVIEPLPGLCVCRTSSVAVRLVTTFMLTAGNVFAIFYYNFYYNLL